MWELLGPTFPCIERERFGSVYDGGKWFVHGVALTCIPGAQTLILAEEPDVVRVVSREHRLPLMYGSDGMKDTQPGCSAVHESP